MTSLGIVDMLDPRLPRASGSGASRQVTPGAAAFADVIQDASRVCADGTGDASAGTATDDASADPTNAPSAPIAPILPAILPSPESGSPTPADQAVLPGGAATGDGTAAPAPAPAPAPAETAPTAPTDATADAADVTLSVASPASPVPSSPVPAAIAHAAAAEGIRAQQQGPASVPTLTPATRAAAPLATASAPQEAPPLTTAAGIGAGEPTGGPTPATTTRLSIAGGPTPGVPGTPHAPAGAAPTAAPRTLDPAALDASSDAAAAAPPAGASSTPAPAPASTGATGDALAPPPAVGSTPPPTTVAAAATPAAVPAARPVLLPQLSAPVVSLAQAPDGDHSLTLTVSPENLGPVTVRAHISGGAIHIELHAPNDLGREALRAILVDLRRDLAAAAPHASLMLSTSDDGPGSSNPQNPANGSGAQNGGSASGTATSAGGGQPGAGASAGREANGARPAHDGALPTPEPTPPIPLVSPHGGIEVFA